MSLPLSQAMVSTLQSQTHGLANTTHKMRVARSWKWSLVLIGGIFYILSTKSEHISRNFLKKISSTHESAINNSKIVKRNTLKKSSTVSLLNNMTENRYLEKEMTEFLSENQERKDLIK